MKHISKSTKAKAESRARAALHAPPEKNIAAGIEPQLGNRTTAAPPQYTSFNPGKPLEPCGGDCAHRRNAKENTQAIQINTVINGPGRNDLLGIAVLSRVLASTSAAFPQMERLLTNQKVLEKLLVSTAPGKIRLGQAFTIKGLSAFPLSLGSLESLPIFDIGKKGTTRHMLDVPAADSDETWRNVNASEASLEPSANLDGAQKAYVDQLNGVSRQLDDASKTPRGKPFRVVTTGRSGPTKWKLTSFIKSIAAGKQVPAVEETEILDTGKRLRGTFGLPEKLEGMEPK